MKIKKDIVERLDLIEQIPLSNFDFYKYLNNPKIFKYDELQQYNNINDILIKNKDYFILLYQLQNINTGHWVCLYKLNNNIYYFDSYGYKIDYPNELSNINKNENHLLNLLNKSDIPVYYNDVIYQDRNDTDDNTCGRHCCFHLLLMLNKNYDLFKYYKYMKEIKQKFKNDLDYSKIITMFINTL